MSKSVNNSNWEIEEIICLRGTETNSSNQATNYTKNNETESSTLESLEPDTILCVLLQNNILGAAYYKISDSQVYVLHDIKDLQPEFLITKCLLREVNPRYIASIGNTCNPFIKCLIDSSVDAEQTVFSDEVRKIPANMSLLPFKEYNVEVCTYNIFEIKLPCSPNSGNEKEMYLQSLINFSNKVSTHALGALIKFLGSSWGHINPNGGELKFMHINQVTLTDHVLMDTNAFNALHVFNPVSHNASFKHGGESSNREGLSLMKLFSQHIKSNSAMMLLRDILHNPTNNIEELNKRLDFVQFAVTPTNQGFIDTLNDNLKKINALHWILSKIQNMRANRKNWQSLYNTIIHILHINELCAPYRNNSALLTQLDTKISGNLYCIVKSISSALDFTDTIKQSRPVIKFGLDEVLDAKKLRFQDIAKTVTTAAHFAVEHLPDYIDSCMVVHVPEMGYLVALKEWTPNCDREQLKDIGFQFMDNFPELDKLLGNLHCDIFSHENRIINRLCNFVMKYNKDIREPLKIISLIDCLISISKVAKEKGFVRPTLNNENNHAIEDSRHPLFEDANFVSNHYHSGAEYSHIKVITGPNASGKSVYLKQIAVVLYLAHIGSFVPATKASIGMLYSIHCRLHATESAAVRLSAFMIDVQQMAQSLYNSKANSLIIIDEFGRGTTEMEGEALLTSSLKHFVTQEVFCPHVLVSTHFQQLSALFGETPLITHMKMDYTVENRTLVFLYKVVPGISTSYAFDVACSIDFDEDVVARAKEIFKCLKNGTEIIPFPDNVNARYNKALDIPMSEFLADIDIPEPDD